MGLVIFLNPPRADARPRRKFSPARRKVALANLKKARAALNKKRGTKSKARPARKKARTTRSKPMARKQTAKQRAAALRNLAKARKARKKKTTRRRPSRAKRTTRRAPAKRSTRRKPARRRAAKTTRRRRAPAPGSRSRVRLRKYRGRYYQGRRGSLKGKTIKVNPPLIPTMKSLTGMVSTAGYGAAGYFGVNLVVMGVNKTGLLGFAASQTPMVQALIRTAVRLLAVPLVARGFGMVFKGGNARQAIMVGAAVNVGLNGIREIGSASGAVPEWGSELLLGGGGEFADYLTMSDYVQSVAPDGMPSKTAPIRQAPNALISSGSFL